MLKEKEVHSGPDFDIDRESIQYALRVIRHRVNQLSAADRRDVGELLEVVFESADECEIEEARDAIREILTCQPSKVHKLPLEPASTLPESLKAYAAHVGAKIRELRKASGLTQEELAAKAGILQSYISRLETDSHSPSHKTLEKIAVALGVPVTQLDPTIEAE